MFSFIKNLFKPKPSSLEVMREAMEEALQNYNNKDRPQLHLNLDQYIEEMKKAKHKQ